MSSKLFEEALADAKKLKEVAEENAKKAILEAVTPRIRDFIEDQLLEEFDAENEADEKEESDVEEADEVVLDESAITSLISMLGGDDIISSLSESKDVLDASISDVVSNMSDKERKKLFNLANKINESAESLSAKNISNNTIQENKTMNKEKFYEIDLQALRESIEEEMEEMMYEEEDSSEGYGMYEDDDKEVEEMMYEEDDVEEDAEMEEMLAEIKLLLDLGDDVEEDQIPEELRGMIMDDEEDSEEPMEMEDEEPLEEPAEAEGEEDSEVLPDMEALNEVFEVDPRMLKQELQRVKRQLREGSMDHHFGGKGTSKAGVKNAFGGSGKAKAGVKGAFGGGSEGQDPFTNPPQINKLNEAIRDLRRKNRSQQEKLTKYRSAVVTLREQLEDLNLFNAKLLYVNKLLQNNSLTESQKKSVIKALDEAKSLDETKSLYKSLTETLASKKTLSESKRYGSSSKTTKRAGSMLSESAGEVSRWQRLAGLK